MNPERKAQQAQAQGSMMTRSSLHHHLIQGIVANGFAPNVQDLAAAFNTDRDAVVEALHDLQAYHGVVLHPHEPKVWVLHPFSMAPTNFHVRSAKGAWWGNCAWCSLGVAALLEGDVAITTTIGAETKQITIRIVDGQVQPADLLIHFPIPMKHAWDNVIYTCSNMLVFEQEAQVDQWARRHNIPKGDVQPIGKIWAFAKKWYGNHLSPTWTKWTVDEAKRMFKEFGLEGRIWDLGGSNERF